MKLKEKHTSKLRMQSHDFQDGQEEAHILATLSGRIHQLRQERGLSLEELAASSDVSIGFLSQLERGIANPSFKTLTKIAKALSVPLSSIFGQASNTADGIVRRDQRKRLMPANADLVYELITPDLNRAFEVVSIEIRPDTAEPDSPFLHEGEECLLVLDGILEFHLGNETHTLEQGDSITFPGTIPHWGMNTGSSPTKLIIIISPPAF
jgi:transcriptional regulator with XRE-family HTH domain